MIINSIFDLNNDIFDLIEEYLILKQIILNYKKRQFNHIINELNKQFFSLDMYFNKLQLQKYNIKKYNKFTYSWLGKRNNERMFNLTLLNNFSNVTKINILNPFNNAKYICSCFKKNCSNSKVSLEEYFYDKHKYCNKDGKILLCLLMSNTNKNHYNSSHILNEIKYNKYSNILKRKNIFEKDKKLNTNDNDFNDTIYFSSDSDNDIGN